MLEMITGREYAEILAFAEHEILPGQRADFRAAMLALVTARAHGVKGVKLADFLLPLEFEDAGGDSDDEQTPEEIDRQMMKLTGMFDASASAKPNGEEESRAKGLLSG